MLEIFMLSVRITKGEVFLESLGEKQPASGKAGGEWEQREMLAQDLAAVCRMYQRGRDLERLQKFGATRERMGCWRTSMLLPEGNLCSVQSSVGAWTTEWNADLGLMSKQICGHVPGNLLLRTTVTVNNPLFQIFSWKQLTRRQLWCHLVARVRILPLTGCTADSSQEGDQERLGTWRDGISLSFWNVFNP